MNEKIIKEREIKGNLEFDGKLIFEANLGNVRVEGFIKASLGIEVNKRIKEKEQNEYRKRKNSKYNNIIQEID